MRRSDKIAAEFVGLLPEFIMSEGAFTIYVLDVFDSRNFRAARLFVGLKSDFPFLQPTAGSSLRLESPTTHFLRLTGKFPKRLVAALRRLKIDFYVHKFWALSDFHFLNRQHLLHNPQDLKPYITAERAITASSCGG